jgi:hypothetical protein
MMLSALIKNLQELEDKYGDFPVDVLTETENTGQVEQELGGVAISVGRDPKASRVKLYPKDFS